MIRSFLVVAFAGSLFACGAPPSGADSGTGGGGGTSGPITCIANRQCSCTTGNCTLNCPSTGGCQANCAGSTCTVNCAGTDGCQLTCGADATCTQVCSGGSCELTGTGATKTQQTCGSASSCSSTCTNVANCKQTAGSGAANCTGCN